jgi:hypothetical protein
MKQRGDQFLIGIRGVGFMKPFIPLEETTGTTSILKEEILVTLALFYPLR